MAIALILAEMRCTFLMNKLGNPRIPLSGADVVIPSAYLCKLCVSVFTDKHNCQVCVVEINGFRNKCGDYVCVWLVHFFFSVDLLSVALYHDSK